MQIVYATRFKNTEAFVKKLDLPHQNIADNDTVTEPFVLVTFTTGFGELPEEVHSFLEKGDNAKYLMAVASAGNRNWKDKFGRAADIVSEQYNVPVLHKFEIRGTKEDVRIFKERFAQLLG